MKIAYIITLMDSIGGAQVHLRDLALEVKRRGHQPVVLTGAAGIITNRLSEAGIETIIVPSLLRQIHPAKDLSAVRHVRRLLGDLRPDIVACHSSKAGIVGRIAARLASLPVVFTAHGWAFTGGVPFAQRSLYLSIERLVGRLSDRIITVSNYDHQLALSARIARPELITTVYNGIPPNEVDLSAGDRHPPRIVMIARFAEPKDHNTLIRALGSLLQRPWELHLIGGGDTTAAMQLCREVRILERTTFWGERPDASGLLGAMDVFVLLSKWEGFPLSVLEAMRASLPVVVSNVGGAPEAVEHGRTGFLVARSDTGEAASAIARLLDSADERRRIGAAGRELFLRRFTSDVMVTRTLEIYSDACGKSESRAVSPP